MTQLTINEARGRLDDLVDAAISGEDVVLVHERHGAVRLVPMTVVSPQPHPIGWLKGQWEVADSFFDPLPGDLLDAFDGIAK